MLTTTIPVALKHMIQFSFPAGQDLITIAAIKARIGNFFAGAGGGGGSHEADDSDEDGREMHLERDN